ncbi:MAG: rRNA pseudouridine synthase [Ardenticatenaceae bacterium]|nr:rRNA pseudouridine synthase [Anaerolineales bacterium]MCB8941797.1 rRNA pseudouridine synthase [Ardenticatenaceae bacterium]MCB8972909.1 rRNA pseudouridine synthase [Ardenticatenaceae bacterium]
MEERIQKLMAQAGVGSRRECEKLIADGRVSVNGRTATLGDKADPATDTIVVNGRPIKPLQTESLYIALHKPKGVISSLDDELEEGRTTVRDLVPLPGHLYPVGRLDKQSTGLILMTNDGDLAHKLTHPRYGHEKTYKVIVEGRISNEALEKWREGMYLDGRKTIPAQITVIRQDVSFTHLEIVMREGRKRQIRRLANMLGFPVRQLVREKIGPLTLGSLKPGDWRHLTAKEVAALKEIVASVKGKRPYRKSGSKPPSRPGKKPGSKPTNRPPSDSRKKSGRSGGRSGSKSKR